MDYYITCVKQSSIHTSIDHSIFRATYCNYIHALYYNLYIYEISSEILVLLELFNVISLSWCSLNCCNYESKLVYALDQCVTCILRSLTVYDDCYACAVSSG